MINFIIEIDSEEDVINNIGETVVNLSAEDFAQQNETSVLLIEETTCSYPMIIVMNYDASVVPSVNVNSASATATQIIGGKFPQRPK